MPGAYFFARVRASSTIVMRWQVALWRRLRRRPPFYGARINAILSDLAHTGPSRRAALYLCRVRTRVEPFPLGDGPGQRIEPFDRSA